VAAQLALWPAENALGLLALGAARTVPLVWAVPAFGGPALPAQIRVALGVGLAGVSFPLLAASVPPTHAVAWAMLGVRELLVGVVMGFVCACAFRAADAAGVLADEVCGRGAVAATRPAGDGQATPLGALLVLVTCVIFFEIGGVAHTARALARSYEAIPLAAALPIADRARDGALLAVLASGKLIEAAVGLAAPVLVAVVLADVAVGVLGRAASRVSPAFAAVPLKAVVGLAALLLAFGGVSLALEGRLGDFFGLLDGALRRSR
jgi:type III secretory pathway component EscT